MTDGRASGWGIVGIGLLLVLAVIASLVFMPLWSCPWCELPRSIATPPGPRTPCKTCGDAKQVSLLKRWRMLQTMRSGGSDPMPLLRLAD